MHNETILDLAEEYANEATAQLTFTKGFPLSLEQLLGLFEIVKAYRKASRILYETEGTDIDFSVFITSIHKDLHDFIDSDIPLGVEFLENLVMSHTINKCTAIYIIKNNINDMAGIGYILEVFEKLMMTDQWERIYELIGDEELWREI